MKPLVVGIVFLVVAEGLPSRRQNRWDNFYESNITWTGHIDEGGNGDIVSFTGPDLRHIEEQIRELEPDFSFSWSHKVDPVIEAESNILCDMAWNPHFASVFHIRQGITYLHRVHGNCTNGPGPGNCARISCSYGSGIWYCNDNPDPMTVPCAMFGDRAWDIVEKCYAFGGKEFPTDSVHGQAFDTAGWNVIVAGTDC